MSKRVRQVKAMRGPRASRVRDEANASWRQVPCEWEAEFATRRNIVHEVENTPHVVAATELQKQVDDEEPSPEPGTPDPIVRLFMMDPDDWDICVPHVDRLEEYCSTARLETLLNEKGPANEAPVALLDERGFLGGQMCSRAQRAPLTQRQLYLELLKPRFAPLESKPAEHPHSYNKSEEPDAERRLIYINDLDPWSVLALMGTASYSQSFALRNTLYRHVEAETLIGVTTPTIGQSMFQLSFHMPYFVWRIEKCDDGRKDTANSRPWASPERVSPPGWQGKGTGGFISGSQFSCVVTGSDNWRWVSYAFADTYHDGPHEGRETLQEYYTNGLADEGNCKDPATLGERDADDPIQDPRLYFLVVIKAWTRRIELEWRQVVSRMKRSVDEYHARASTSTDAAESNGRSLRQLLHWVVYTADLANKLSRALSSTVRACENFWRGDAVYFENLPGSGKLLGALRRSFDELERLKYDLDDLEHRCDGFAKRFKMQLSVETNCVGEGQHAVALHSNLLATIMMFLAPPMMAATVFSMNKEVISFMSLSFRSFIGMTLGFWAVILIVYLALQQRFRADCCAVFSALMDRKAWTPSTRDRLRWLWPFRRGGPNAGDLGETMV